MRELKPKVEATKLFTFFTDWLTICTSSYLRLGQLNLASFISMTSLGVSELVHRIPISEEGGQYSSCNILLDVAINIAQNVLG